MTDPSPTTPPGSTPPDADGPGAPGAAATALVLTRTVDAPVQRVFALIADPDRHPEIDASGMVRAARTHQVLTALGERFTMAMSTEALGDYEIDNVVVVYEPDRALGWAPAPPGEDPVGHTWTWRLTPTAVDATEITLTYDWSSVTSEWLLGSLPVVGSEALAASLGRVAELLG